MENKIFLVVAVLSSSIVFSGCSFDLSITQQEPEMMCSGDTLSVTAESTKRASKIRVYNGRGNLLYSESNVKKVELTVPDIQESDLQFKVVARKKRRFWFDKKITIETDFKLFDNLEWYDNGGLVPTNVVVVPEAKKTLVEETRGNRVCMEWDIETEECTRFENVQSSRACFVVKEFFFTYRGVDWNLQPNTDYSNHIKVSKVKNLADRPVTVVYGGASGQSAELQPNTTFSFNPAVNPGTVSITYRIPADQQEKRLCKKVTQRINCGSSVGMKDFPPIEECFEIPTIDMELFCEQAP